MDFRETSFDYISCDDAATLSTSEAPLIRRLLKMHEDYPDQIEITHHPDSNGGVLVIHLPKKWLKISPPRKMTLTDAQRDAARERLSNARKKKGGN